ncbi:MAG: Gfo/Idh/MocA family oxidoreductase [Deinococcales bacterium]
MNPLPSEFDPLGPPKPVCQKGEFPFAAAYLDHGHIYGQCEALIEAGGNLCYVYDKDPDKVAEFVKKFPEVKVLTSEEALLDKEDIKLITAAAVTSQRGPLGLRVMAAGKDYFTDKAPFTTLEQLEAAREAVISSGKKYMVYYSERLHVESAMHAGEMIRAGAIGQVIQVLGLGPHRLRPESRPAWFFERATYGGILCDIGSHQIEQFLHYGGVKDAKVLSARADNLAHPDYPELEDFGEATLKGDNGCSNYFRVDWFTPKGLGTWGDGRMMILGTEGYIELRKYIDISRGRGGNHVFLVNGQGEFYMDVTGKVGHPFFGAFILDCLNRSEAAMTQEHAFKAAELCLKAQILADTHKIDQQKEVQA